MSELSKVKAWAVKNGVSIVIGKENGAICLRAPATKSFAVNGEHTLTMNSGSASETWKNLLKAIRDGLEECPVVCTCRPVAPEQAVPRLNVERAVVTPPISSVPVTETGWNRERWLTELAGKLRPVLEGAGAVLPASFKLSCGWPSKNPMGSKNRTIGQCFAPSCSAGGVTEMFISPSLSDPLEVAAVAVHELIHASGAFKHTGSFKKIALAAGLEGRMTATVAGEKLKARLNALLAELPAYPHFPLSAMKGTQKKDGTRLLKVVCPSPECGYVIRTTQKWVEVGFPTCPCGERMALAEGEKETEEN